MGERGKEREREKEMFLVARPDAIHHTHSVKNDSVNRTSEQVEEAFPFLRVIRPPGIFVPPTNPVAWLSIK